MDNKLSTDLCPYVVSLYAYSDKRNFGSAARYCFYSSWTLPIHSCIANDNGPFLFVASHLFAILFLCCARHARDEPRQREPARLGGRGRAWRGRGEGSHRRPDGRKQWSRPWVGLRRTCGLAYHEPIFFTLYNKGERKRSTDTRESECKRE